ncbi:hypothetical protein GCM10009081_20130 [Brevundimonas nasdae]
MRLCARGGGGGGGIGGLVRLAAGGDGEDGEGGERGEEWAHLSRDAIRRAWSKRENLTFRPKKLTKEIGDRRQVRI